MEMNLKPIRIAIIGTGGMANQHVEAYKEMPDVSVVAGVDTNLDALNKFCDQHEIENRFEKLADLIAWGEFDGVSNVTPDNVHYVTSMGIMAAHKHVLCEKPLASNYADAREMANFAQTKNIINMVNLSYRNRGAMQMAANMVANGDIGAVKHIEASYLQSWLIQPSWGDWKTEKQWLWRLSKNHGSKGALGDVGIHILDFATFVAGSMPLQFSSQLATFSKAPNDQIGEYKLDANDSFVMNLQLKNGALGTISATRYAAGHFNDLRLRIFGDKGGLEINLDGEVGSLRGCLNADLNLAEWKDIAYPEVETNYQKFVTAIRTGVQTEPSFERGAQLQKILDEIECGQNKS